MTTPYQKTLLEWHATGQVALIDVATRTVKKVGPPAMVRSIDASPDGKYVRVTRMVKPFSYDVPVGNFGSIEEIWDAADGKVLVKLNDRQINMGVQDDQPPVDPQAPPAAAGGGGRAGNQNQTGRRELAWRHDGQGLTYLEQEPHHRTNDAAGGGGAGGAAAARPPRPTIPAGRPGAWQTAAPRKDRFVVAAAVQRRQQEGPPRSNTRMTGHRFSPDMQTVFFSERAGQNTRSAVALEPAKRYARALSRG